MTLPPSDSQIPTADPSGPATNKVAEPLPDVRRRLACFAAYLILIAACSAPYLIQWLRLALESDLQSHILLIPFISGYLIYTIRGRLPRSLSSSWLGSAFFAIGAVLIFVLAIRGGVSGEVDRLALVSASFIFAVVAGGFACFGSKWMRIASFPFFFLLFAIPLPDGVVDTLETGLILASAEAAHFLFEISGVPYLRDGLIFQLPGIVLEVAQECSGIRSSYVLLITSVLAGYLLLNRPLHRAVVALVVIPLGILRNGFRIVVIGWLCVEVGPHMVHHAIHKRGGPLFFGLSLVPFFALVWWLKRRELHASSLDGSAAQREEAQNVKSRDERRSSLQN